MFPLKLKTAIERKQEKEQEQEQEKAQRQKVKDLEELETLKNTIKAGGDVIVSELLDMVSVFKIKLLLSEYKIIGGNSPFYTVIRENGNIKAYRCCTNKYKVRDSIFNSIFSKILEYKQG